MAEAPDAAGRPAGAAEPWEALARLAREGRAAEAHDLLAGLGAGARARALSRLERQARIRLFTLLEPAFVARLLRALVEEQASDFLDDLPPELAAGIVAAMPSDDQADVLGVMTRGDAAAILESMSPAQAADATRLLRYAPETAGGLMVTEYLAYRQSQRVADALADLRAHRAEFAHYDVQYVYVTDDVGTLTGVLRLRDLLFAPAEQPLAGIMLSEPLRVRTDARLESLDRFFDRHHLLGVPVVDRQGRLVGVLLRQAVEESAGRRAGRQILSLGGIVGGEEFRTMPLAVRARRRLSFLVTSILLNVVAVAVIAWHQDTLRAVIALTVFLPLLGHISSSSGSQAIAVSLRELTLGLVRPREVARVLAKEAGIGLVNGLALGLLLGGAAWGWSGNPYLGLIVGAAVLANAIVAVCVGGVLPLVLKGLRLDPALLSGPALVAVTNTCGFLLLLRLATALLPRLCG